MGYRYFEMIGHVTRRDFLKLVGATTAALAFPVIAESQQRLDLVVEVDQDKLEQAFTIRLEKDHAVAEIDTEKMWQAVYATDQWGRHWATTDGNNWTCGEDSFTI